MINLSNVLFSKEAEKAINELKVRLRLFSKIIKRNEEPFVLATLGENGILKINVSIKSAKGKVDASIDIPSEYWK